MIEWNNAIYRSSRVIFSYRHGVVEFDDESSHNFAITPWSKRAMMFRQFTFTSRNFSPLKILHLEATWDGRSSSATTHGSIFVFCEDARALT